MKHSQWLVLFVALVLMAGTAGALIRFKTHQRLGRPGITATALPGCLNMKIELPEQVLDLTSTNVPEPEVVLGYLPKDTSFAERFYQGPDGFWATGTIILMGADRTSIHRPEYCFLGQGWNVDKKTRTTIPIAGASPYELPVMKWEIRKTVTTPDGQKQTLYGLYYFWFVADNDQVTGNVQLQCHLIENLLLRGVLQRWAYISYFSYTGSPEHVKVLSEQMQRLIAASVPAYQLPPRKP
ncbi:MAG TPA: exosortase-associated EpsI family protein [Candidatus Acidoferrum sp.]|nr:exosortase-associated EpsI family protein [Candidatus Acidoferrum sp.]